MVDTKVEALKALCVAIRNDGTKADDVEGDTVTDIIKQITIAVRSTTQTLGTLTVNSTLGSTSGTTKITVSGSSGGSLRYKTGSNVPTVEYLEDVGDWTMWDGTSEIAAIDGYRIAVVETDEDNLAISYGSTMVIAS